MNFPLKFWQEAARRSVLFSCAPSSVACALTSIEKCCGSIDKAYYWCHRNRPGCLLIQAKSEESLRLGLTKLPYFSNIVTNSGFSSPDYSSSLPSYRRFRLSSDPSRFPVLSHAGQLNTSIPSTVSRQNLAMSSKQLQSRLSICKSFEEQVNLVFDSTRLTEADLLARFVVADAIREVICQYRPYTNVFPFGSAVNGLGSVRSDLDLVVNVGQEIAQNSAPVSPSVYKNMHYRSLLSCDDELKPVFLATLRHTLHRLDPLGFRDARVYLGRVPILHLTKFDLLGVSVDISRIFASSVSVKEPNSMHEGDQMARLLRTLSYFSPQFAKSVAVVKYVFRQSNLTRPGPSPGFTNFKILMLFLHFLQVYNYVPSLDQILRLNTEDYNSLTMSLHSLSQDHFSGLQPFPEVGHLLLQFFSYLPTVNPAHFNICLSSGRCLPRNVTAVDVNSCGFMALASDSDGASINDVAEDFVLCSNPFFITHNMLRGIDELQWSHLVSLCNQWSDVIRNQHAPNGGSAPWGLLVRCHPRAQPDGHQAGFSHTTPVYSHA